MNKSLAIIVLFLALCTSSVCWSEPEVMPSEPAAAVVERVCSSTAFVSTTKGGLDDSGGSGVVIIKTKTEAWIITSDHVVAGSDTVSASIGRNEDIVYGCDVVRELDRECGDLALLHVAQRLTCPAIPVAKIPPSRGDHVFSVGAPYGIVQMVMYGRVAGLRPRFFEASTAEMLMLDIGIGHGCSGGPVCNSKGEIVGLCRSVFPESTLASATTASNIRKFMGWK